MRHPRDPRPRPPNAGHIGSLGGLCNRSACRAPGANWYHRFTRKHYCQRCAIRINEHNPESLCARVGARGTKTEMAQLVQAGLAFETFAHQTLGHFDISALRQVLKSFTPITIHHCRFDQLAMVDGMSPLRAWRD